MARREYAQGRKPFTFPFAGRLHTVDSAWRSCAPKSPLSPVDIITRSVQSMKRFFTTTSKDGNTGDNRGKRARLYKRSDFKATGDSSKPHTRRETAADENEYFVPPQRTRRNGMVFDDITVWTQNVSNSLPNRKSAVLRLSDFDFTKPQPEWVTSAIIQTSTDIHHPTVGTTVPSNERLPAKKTIPVPKPSIPPPQMIDFVSIQEFLTLQEMTSSSISALPPQPGFLQDMLATQIMTSLTTLITSAENGLDLAWQKDKVSLPSHFNDAIVFIVSACESIATALTADPVRAGDVTAISRLFEETVELVMKAAKIVDGMDFRGLITDYLRMKCVEKLTSTLDIFNSAAREFPVDVETTLEMLARKLDAVLPTMLIISQFRVHQVLVEYLLVKAIDRLVSDTIVPRWALEKLDHVCPIVKRIKKQLDRMAAEDHIDKDLNRQKLIDTYDTKRDMLKYFADAIASKSVRTSFAAFRKAAELAKAVGEPKVQAECLYCMAHLMVSRGKASLGNHPSVLLASARSLNASDAFQTKVQSLVVLLRRQSLSSIIEMSEAVHESDDLVDYVEGVKIFVRVLLSKYPSDGVDGDTVLEGDIVKGMLKVVRVFHPDKNRSVNEAGRWLCEEITKVCLNSLTI
jgi:hypothetical protein